ncbi:MAG: diguanylate cyclase [Candidatus Latescibacteria bacterium]|nr:diguanylate cyclase [Candidatus Latescibacterota bacterium]
MVKNHHKDDYLSGLIDRLTSVFHRPLTLHPDLPSEYYRRFVFVNYIYFSSFVAHVLFWFIFEVIHAEDMALFSLVTAAVYLFCILLNFKGFYTTGIVFFAIEINLFILMCVFTFGDAGFHYFFFPIFSLLFLISIDQPIFRIVWAIVECVLFGVLSYYLPEISKKNEFDPYIIDFLRVLNTYLSFFFLGFAGYYYSQYALKAENLLRKIATTDSLTGLSNRRDFINKIKNEMARFDRNNKPFTVVMGDIDHFKKCNDTFGHDFGDFVIQRTAQLMVSSLRQQDFVGRWGGEEFLVVLPETTLEKGDKVAEKIRTVIASSPFSFRGKKYSVTMSFGVSVYDHAMTMDDVINKADECLYIAKGAGRNRVVALKE